MIVIGVALDELSDQAFLGKRSLPGDHGSVHAGAMCGRPAAPAVMGAWSVAVWERIMRPLR